MRIVQIELNFNQAYDSDILLKEAMMQSAQIANRRERLKEKRPDWNYQRTFKGYDMDDLG